MSTIQLTINDGLATLVMSRPERKNAMTGQMFVELLDALTELRRNPDVRALLLTGAGSDFCSGGDVSTMQGGVEASFMRMRMTENNRLLAALADFDRPVVAAVDGVAFGAGFSVALAADFIIASERARFCMAFARIGLAPDLGASYFLPRLVGLPKAREIIYTAREIGANEARELGLALEVVPAGELHARAEAIARSLSRQSTCAFAMTKRLLGRSLESGLHELLDAEAAAQAVALSSDYLKEASARFVRKEPPLFQWPERD
ncbi:4-chlorobenzoyl coenzyme A dehalogenase-1 [compost metagenome]